MDLSLSNSGIAVAVDGKLENFGAVPGKGAGIARLIADRDSIMDRVDQAKPDFVIMEDVAYSMNKSYAKENAGLAFIIRVELFTEKIPFIVVASSSLKKFCSGSGSAKKEMMIKEVLKRWGVDCPDNDTADAVALAFLGMALTGEWTPTIQPQREVVEQVTGKNAWLRTLRKPEAAAAANPVDW